VLRVDRVLTAEMRGDNAREDSGHCRELELIPVSEIQEPKQELRR
jgi:hypothetical protein